MSPAAGPGRPASPGAEPTPAAPGPARALRAGRRGAQGGAHEDDDGWPAPEWSPVWDGPVVVRGLRSPLAYVPGALAATGLVALGAALAGGLVAGRPGALAGPAAALTVAVFFGVSALAVAAADRRDPQLTLPVALGAYVVKVVVAGVVAFRVVDGPARWHAVFAASLGAALVAWLGAHAVWFWRTPPATVERAGADPDGAGGAGGAGGPAGSGGTTAGGRRAGPASSPGPAAPAPPPPEAGRAHATPGATAAGRGTPRATNMNTG